MLDRSLIGRESEPVVHDVERTAIRRFADALGDPNPLYQDEAGAKSAGYPALVAGDRITVVSRVADVLERPSASGPMDVIVLEDEARDDKGEVVFRARATLILRRG